MTVSSTRRLARGNNSKGSGGNDGILARAGPGIDSVPAVFTQEWFITLDQGDDGGTFGPRFMTVDAARVTGHVDLAILQGSLDDVVARHELLRTLVVRDADPPYQVVLPPCRVPLEVRDLPPVTGKSRDLVVQELILEAEQARSARARSP